ncbi:hypothetical protein [Mesorhizobium sp.]|uniref:hypothetical protein n=1 Tax=Mesorhizobium sp. TaxID=1871066 RepID=UPI00120DB24B|nr:hypothetical protein [Mesorhizobium sp.]TIN78336.1 MAG: hypothetical protein E5Y09_13190 [Mesorhizobium sp.]
MEIRAAWGDRWPDSEKTIMRYDDLNNALRCVGTEAMRLLGWTMDEARMPEGSEFKYRDAWLNAQIPPDEHRELALQMHAGRLKAVTLANVLAFHGLQPKEDRRAA